MNLKNVKLLIVGIGGVGKEHIRAAYKLGIKNVVLLDVSLQIIAEFEKGTQVGYVWNIWDKTKEKINLPKGVKVIKAYADIPSDITHVVIATPTKTHIQVVDKIKALLPKAKILLEKPLSETKEKPKVDYVGYDYQYKFRKGNNILLLSNSKKQQNIGNIKFDLLSHLIYLALQNGRKIMEVQELTKDMCYAKTNKGDLLIAARNQDRHYVSFNEEIVIDYSKLFTEQLRKFLSGQSNYNVALRVEDCLI